LGGLAGADVYCNNVATSASLGGNWKAILSSSSVNVKDRITVTGEIRNRNNDVVASNTADFWDGTLASAINYNELGNVAGAGGVWTGSNSDGTLSGAGSTCLDWIDSLTANYGRSGGGGATNTEWLAVADVNCDQLQHIYCIDGQ
jgi:hypothetical protein